MINQDKTPLTLYCVHNSKGSLKVITWSVYAITTHFVCIDSRNKFSESRIDRDIEGQPAHPWSLTHAGAVKLYVTTIEGCIAHSRRVTRQWQDQILEASML